MQGTEVMNLWDTRRRSYNVSLRGWRQGAVMGFPSGKKFLSTDQPNQKVDCYGGKI